MTQATVLDLPRQDAPLKPIPSDPLQPRKVKPTDDELGDMLIEKWNGEYRYMYGAWHRYGAGIWKLDRRVEMQFWRILIENKVAGIKPNASKAASVEKYCQMHLMVDDELESGDTLHYINLRNGLYNLEYDGLEKHRPGLYFTSQLGFEYNPKATAPTWRNFLATVLVDSEGNTDHELINLVQEAFYYSLTADTSYRVSFWTVGASGTGKSTLVNTLIALAGDSWVAIDLDSLKDNQYQLADIAGKRLVTFSEPDSRQPLADGWYKKLVSKDPISARQIHGKPFNFVPICKVWGSMNDTPKVVDRSDAVFNRVIIIPMNHVIPHDQRDGNLDEKLLNELPGIFNWCLEGGRRLRHNGHFTRSRQSEAARDDFRKENDTERLYMTERCQTGNQYKVAVETIYQDYKTWCDESGYRPKAKVQFGKDLARLGFKAGRGTAGARFWSGITLNSHT